MMGDNHRVKKSAWLTSLEWCILEDMTTNILAHFDGQHFVPDEPVTESQVTPLCGHSCEDSVLQNE